MLFNIQRLHFLLRLTFIIVTAAATFTTRRLLSGNRWYALFPLPLPADGSHASRQSAAVPGDDYDGFLRDYRCLQYVHYEVAALITVTAVVLTRLATILLTFRFRFCFRCWLLGRFGFFTTAEQRFQCAEEAAQQRGWAGAAGVAGADLGAGATTGAAGSAGVGAGGTSGMAELPAQVVPDAYVQPESSSDGSAIASSCSFGSM